MPNKESKPPELKLLSSPAQPVAKAVSAAAKLGVGKPVKDSAMSPTQVSNPGPEGREGELLGSLTTLQQQRTSARVIKKLSLEPDKDKRGKADDTPDCETPSKEDKDLKFPTVKQRMPKALWSTDEKNLFFEALNEYGKDFDAITAYICAKMKKKGMTDAHLKTKTQVSHFYYRTWHKLSKHVHFDENVKKVAQELYALINYGELRKKVVPVSEKTCARLGELVVRGSLVVRARGRSVRVRTPACRALRSLNQITERSCGSRICSRATVLLRARTLSAWSRVQAAAHNPRAAVELPLRTPLVQLIRALQRRWTPDRTDLSDRVANAVKIKENINSLNGETARPDEEAVLDALHVETDRVIVQEQKLPERPVLHVGPRPDAAIHIPTVSPSEQLSSQKICFSSYLERMVAKHKDAGDGGAKIRTPKRQRKDSATDKDKEIETKKFKSEECESIKLINIDETAIDGIELMANYKSNMDDEEKTPTDDEKELKSEETAEDEEVIDRDKDMSEIRDMSEREKDSFSEMEDDEKYNKSDSDNESDHKDKTSKDTKFKNLKVKFLIRPKKRGRSEYTLVLEKDQDEVKEERDEDKTEIDIQESVRQVRGGWSAGDAGELTIGDLYLMFGCRSKLELEYWWAKPSPPLPRPVADKLADKHTDKHADKDKKADKTPDKDSCDDGERARESDTDIFSPKNNYNQDSNDGLSGDERKSEQLASPDHKSSASIGSGALKLASKLINRPQTQPPNNGFSQLSDRLKRLLSLAGNPLVSAARGPCPGVSACTNTHQLTQACPNPTAAVVFRHPPPIAPRPPASPTGRPVNLESLPRWRRGRPPRQDRRVVVQRLLPLLPKLPHTSKLIPVGDVPKTPQPPRILPKPPPTSTSDLSFFYVLSESNGQFFFHDGDRRIPISPLPQTDRTEDAPATTGNTEEEDQAIQGESEAEENAELDAKTELDPKSGLKLEGLTERRSNNHSAGDATIKNDQADISNLLPSESLSLSPSRLLRDSESWLEGGVHDFSLSSFLHQLDGRTHQDLAVDSQLHSLMAESSVDYVAKFADLAAEVTDETPPDLA